ncbi:uncharacterized protein I206_104609 [Kwoniella pini CBS 10737]|uniref:Uncharacterized protein n=1 Tax=Kwoniella pini CBS 10737 TaxID=1296096 RepID=A0A1B9I7I0_9TREE|nr:uncharacterized protein I206_02143 [Kwoniella pini CBS 10737]OCF51429.1 hypothetical protein I206_02143 [Kwoniella pini CBS 10737]
MALVSTHAPTSFVPSSMPDTLPYTDTDDDSRHVGEMLNPDGTVTAQGARFFDEQRRRITDRIKSCATDHDSKKFIKYMTEALDRTIEDGMEEETAPGVHQYIRTYLDSWQERAPVAAKKAEDKYNAIMQHREVYRDAHQSVTAQDTAASGSGQLLPASWATNPRPKYQLTQYPSEEESGSDSDYGSGSSGSTAISLCTGEQNTINKVPDTQIVANDPKMHHLRVIGKTAHPSLLPADSQFADSELVSGTHDNAQKPYNQALIKPMNDWLASRHGQPSFTQGNATGGDPVRSISPFVRQYNQSNSTNGRYPTSTFSHGNKINTGTLAKAMSNVESLFESLAASMNPDQSDVVRYKKSNPDGTYQQMGAAQEDGEDGSRTEITFHSGKRGNTQFSSFSSLTTFGGQPLIASAA